VETAKAPTSGGEKWKKSWKKGRVVGRVGKENGTVANAIAEVNVGRGEKKRKNEQVPSEERKSQKL